MKKIIYILLSIIAFTSCSKNTCRLDDGKYRVIYDKEFSEFHYEISYDTVKEIYHDNYVISVIEWISDKDYLLSDLPSYLTYKDDLNKEQYTYNRPFYRLTYCGNDTISFDLMKNEDSIVNSGKLIKIK